MSGCGRAIAVIPISQDVFDALFNGRSVATGHNIISLVAKAFTSIV